MRRPRHEHPDKEQDAERGQGDTDAPPAPMPRLRDGLMGGLPWALRLSYLAFPIVSSQAFSALNCACFDTGKSFMVADYSTQCRVSGCDAETPGPRTAEYEDIYRLSVAIIVVSAIGVPEPRREGHAAEPLMRFSLGGAAGQAVQTCFCHRQAQLHRRLGR